MSTSITASKQTQKKVGRGRPRSKGIGEQCVVRLHEPLLTAIDQWCENQLDRPTRAEGLRRLAARALAAESADAGKPRPKAKR
jgi:hypothetical protein